MGGGLSGLAVGNMLHVRQNATNDVFMVISAPEGLNPAEAALEAYTDVGQVLREHHLAIVQERVFGSLASEVAVKAARRKALRSWAIPNDHPMSYLQGRPVWGEGFAGAIIRAVATEQTNNGVRNIVEAGEPRGRIWEMGDATCIVLQNVRGLGGSWEDNSPATQTRRAIERADRLLRENGAAYGDTVRTWFYLADILDWYGQFNQARSEMYEQLGLWPAPAEPHILPASTGIQVELSGRAACALDLLAVTGSQDCRPVVSPLRNPLQQEAFRYGSAFSRGAVIHGPAGDLIEISGTAAIDGQGASMHAGQVRAQVHSTLEKMAGVIEGAGAALTEICAATVFIKNAEDATAVQEEIESAGLEDFPAVYVVADVCRDELLFEIDAEAVVLRPDDAE